MNENDISQMNIRNVQSVTEVEFLRKMIEDLHADLLTARTQIVSMTMELIRERNRCA